MGAATAIIAGTTLFSAAMSQRTAAGQAKAMRAQGDYERSIYEANADLLTLKAEDTIERGKKDSAAVRRSARVVQGAQRAGFAGQGVDVNTGSAALIQDETYTMGELDALTVKNNAFREAWGYKVEATRSRFSGRMAQIAANVNARTTLLTGGIQAVGALTQGAYMLKR